ncbi:MAG TPA: 2Fe-2S iron-sulfur cluster-binding protein, partial [Pricia sp.]|nr:2Fe-2S iron-sulfur cluster-binding protein [Pricia sp.]
MKLTLKIWRQKSPVQKGKLVEYRLNDVNPDDSFLEMLDTLNYDLIVQGENPIAFDHDCREGICGM